MRCKQFEAWRHLLSAAPEDVPHLRVSAKLHVVRYEHRIESGDVVAKPANAAL